MITRTIGSTRRVNSDTAGDSLSRGTSADQLHWRYCPLPQHILPLLPEVSLAILPALVAVLVGVAVPDRAGVGVEAPHIRGAVAVPVPVVLIAALPVVG